MKTLRIDDTWSVEYDPSDNDRPHHLLHHGKQWIGVNGNANAWGTGLRAMFHALLEAHQASLTIPAMSDDEMQELRDLAMKDTRRPRLLDDPTRCGFGPQSQLRVYAVAASIHEAESAAPVYFPVERSAAELVNDSTFVAAFLSALADRVHADNVTAGWWSDLNTGESTLHTRNVPEMLMLMLIVSEIANRMKAGGKHF